MSVYSFYFYSNIKCLRLAIVIKQTTRKRKINKEVTKTVSRLDTMKTILMWNTY